MATEKRRRSFEAEDSDFEPLLKQQRLNEVETVITKSYIPLNSPENYVYNADNSTDLNMDKLPTNSSPLYDNNTDTDSRSYATYSHVNQPNHILVVDSSGNTCTLSLKKPPSLTGRQYKFFRHRPSQLLSVPFIELKRIVEEKRYKKIMEMTDEALESLRGNEMSMELLEDTSETESDTKDSSSQLWSEKYSPKLFTELLSDDGVNRTLLSWLKLWDEAVFGRSCLLKESSNLKQDKKVFKKNFQKSGKKFKPNQWEVQDPKSFASDEALDDQRRPKQKLILLCGPPGIGKTTLAHVVALQGGYNVVEVNASDDRSPEVFKKMLESSTEMKAVLTSNSKPNCLIIDEIDGAPAAAINVLIDVIKTKSIGKKKSKSFLSRPIICICNDLYTTSLRQLRQYAIILPVPSTVTTRLAGRLSDVCRKEGLSINTSTLMVLCEKADNDIRTCLNTLQFIHHKKTDISLATVQTIAIGLKDSQKSLLTFWKDVFKLPSTKKYSYSRSEDGGLFDALSSHSIPGSEREKEDLQATRFYNMLSEASSTGEYEKVLQGLFENYLNVKLRDPNMEIVSETQDWISFQETLLNMIQSTQEYYLMSYLPYVSVVFHFLYAGPTGHRVQYPHTQFENNQKFQRYQQLLSQMMSDTNPIVRQNIDPLSSAVYFVPLLLNIITPNLRPVNIQLYTRWEKELLNNVVQIMTYYNISYRQDRTIDGQYTYFLEPDLEELCHYSGLLQKRQLQYATKQLLAREIELAKVKGEVKHENVNISANRSSSKLKVTTVENKDRTEFQRDFFGQPVKSETRPDSIKETRTGSSTSIWFRFNEGFSDAVKKSIRIQDLL